MFTISVILKWVLCTGIFMDDIEQAIDQKKTALLNATIVHIQLVAGIILLVLVCIMALGIRITRKISGSIYRIIRGLNDGADQVATAAGEVSSVSQTLAEGASEQAASIEETSSSLEESASVSEALNAQAQELKVFVTELSEMVSGRASATNGNHAVNSPRSTVFQTAPDLWRNALTKHHLKGKENEKKRSGNQMQTASGCRGCDAFGSGQQI
jgi:plasmid maintenance system antidote protein VapI